MRTLAATLVALLVLVACSQPAATPSSAATEREPTGAPSAVPTDTPTPTVTPRATQTAAAAETAWRELGADGPAAREDHTWTVDDDGATAYLFGGRDGATVHGDLWAFDLASSTWSDGPLAPAGEAPAARFGHEAVWVDGVGLVVVFGQAGTTFFGDIWAFDPTSGRWSQLPSGGSAPVARYGSCAALGPDGRLWISHGFTAENARFADTRAYDFESGTWTDETPDGDLPVSRCLHGCWWTDEGMLRLYAGQTNGVTALGDLWELDGDRGWRQLDGSLPAERNLYARTRVGGATIVFGGQGADAGYVAGLYRLADGAAGAAEIDVRGDGPGARAGAELIHDPARARLLLSGGRDGAGARSDVWEVSGIGGD